MIKSAGLNTEPHLPVIITVNHINPGFKALLISTGTMQLVIPLQLTHQLRAINCSE